VADGVRAGTPHGAMQLDVERLGRLVGGDPHDVAGLDSGAAAEREVDQHVRVALQYLLGRGVGRHARDPTRFSTRAFADFFSQDAGTPLGCSCTARGQLVCSRQDAERAAKSEATEV
jgi:hypothetical protein